MQQILESRNLDSHTYEFLKVRKAKSQNIEHEITCWNDAYEDDGSSPIKIVLLTRHVDMHGVGLRHHGVSDQFIYCGNAGIKDGHLEIIINMIGFLA
jgi:hypothetical protein